MNSKGATSTSAATVRVKDAAPGTPALSHDNGDRDGQYTVSADLWWGTNATSYRFLEDGVVVLEDDIAANTPSWQRAQLTVDGKEPGVYTYAVEFTNAAGTTASRSMQVRVTR